MQAHCAGLDELLQITARKLRHQVDQGVIQAFAVLRGQDQERAQLEFGGQIRALLRIVGDRVARYN